MPEPQTGTSTVVATDGDTCIRLGIEATVWSRRLRLSSHGAPEFAKAGAWLEPGTSREPTVSQRTPL